MAGGGARQWGSEGRRLNVGGFGEIRILRVAGEAVHLLVRAPNVAQHIPTGEFIVLGATTGIQYDAAAGLSDRPYHGPRGGQSG